MERRELEPEAGCDFEMDGDFESDISEVGDDGVGCFTRWWRGHVYTPFGGGGEMELASMWEGGTESHMDDREDEELASIVGARHRHRMLKSQVCVVSVLCVVSLVIYICVSLLLMSSAGRGIGIEYLGSAELSLTCNGAQHGSGLFRFTRSTPSKISLQLKNPKFSFGRPDSPSWGHMEPSHTLSPTSTSPVTLSGRITVGSMGEIQLFLSEYLNWRVGDTQPHPTIHIKVEGSIGASFFPFWVPTTVHTTLPSPTTTTAFTPTSLSALFPPASLSVSLNITESGLHAWIPNVNMTFDVATSEGPLATVTTTTTSLFEKKLLITSTHGAACGGYAAHPTELTVEGVGGACLPQQIMGGVAFNVSVAHVGMGGGGVRLNSGTLHKGTMTVNTTYLRGNGSTTLPVVVGGMGLRLGAVMEGEDTSFISVVGPEALTPLTALPLQLSVPEGECRVFSSVYNTLTLPLTCFTAPPHTWLGGFFSTSQSCFASSHSPGHGLWQVVAEPQAYIKEALAVTDRRLSKVTQNGFDVSLSQAWPGGVPIDFMMSPFRVGDLGVPNITLGAVTAHMGGVFDVEAVSEPSPLDASFWNLVVKVGVGVGDAGALRNVLSGIPVDLSMNISASGLSLTGCTFTTPSWGGMLLPVDNIVTNPYPVPFVMSQGAVAVHSGRYTLQAPLDIAKQQYTPSYEAYNTTANFSIGGGGVAATISPHCLAAQPMPDIYKGQDYSCVCDVLDSAAECGLTWEMLPDEVCQDVALRPAPEVTLYQTCHAACVWCASDPFLVAPPNISLV